MAPEVLVTGATGFIGRALATRLAEQGMGLRLLVRDVERARRLGLSSDQLVAGSLGDRASLERAVDGVTGVVHLAGLTRAKDRATYERVNRQGTRDLVAATVAKARDARFVLVSSLAAAGPSVDGQGSANRPDACRPVSVYGRSKLGGEQELLALGPSLDWIVIRPPIVYGPGDDGTRLLFKQAAGPIAAVPFVPRPLSLIHVDDLVRALVLALDARGVTGHFLPVEGKDRLDTDSMIDAVARARGRKLRKIRVPMLCARLAAIPVEFFDKLRGTPGFFNRDKMREASAPGWVCDPEPIAAALGFRGEIATVDGFADVLRRDEAIAARMP